MIIEIPIAVTKYGEIIPNVITGEDERELLEEYESTAKIYVDNILAWYELGRDNDAYTQTSTTEGFYVTQLSLEEYEANLLEQLLDYEHELTEKARHFLNYLTKS